MKTDEKPIEVEDMIYVTKERNTVDVNMQQYLSLLKLKISSEVYKKSLRDSFKSAKLWLQIYTTLMQSDFLFKQ